MGAQRRAREVALQALYQMELRGGGEDPEVGASVRSGPQDERSKESGLAWAQRAWALRTEADDLASELAPAWPSERQPTVDRAILRLAYWELVAGTPPPVVINESVELAKRYSTQRSAKFLNGVLDRMRHRVPRQSGRETTPPGRTPEQSAADPWLEDALRDSSVSRSPDREKQ